MVHIGNTAVLEPVRDTSPFSARPHPVRQSVMIVRDAHKNTDFLDSICAFLDIDVEHVSGDDDLTRMLLAIRPVAVIADLDGETQDGFHVMKIAAMHDRKLPVLLLGDGNAALLGAVDAMGEACGLTNVLAIAGAEGVGSMVDFLCHAVRDSGMPGLMRL